MLSLFLFLKNMCRSSKIFEIGNTMDIINNLGGLSLLNNDESIQV